MSFAWLMGMGYLWSASCAGCVLLLKAATLLAYVNCNREHCWAEDLPSPSAGLRGTGVNFSDAALSLHMTWTAGIAEEIGRHLLVYGRRIPKAELFARIDAVDASVIKAVADRFIYDQDVAIAAQGDLLNLPDYNWFRRRTYWLRY